MSTFSKELKPFQLASKDRMVKDRKHFLLYEMGLGKTPTTVQALYEVDPDVTLILCPKNAMRTWEDHIKEWFAGLDERHSQRTPYIIRRWRSKYHNKDKRLALIKGYTPNVNNIYIMTPDAFVRDHTEFPHQPDVIIFDEFHRKLRNRKSKTFEALKPFAKDAPFFWASSGTPGRTPEHFWTLFHLCNPKYYGSYWKFVGAFNYVMTNEFGRKEILGLKNPENWYRELSRKASVVTKPMVADQSGKGTITRQLLHVTLDDIQQQHYANLSKDMMAITDDNILFAKTSLERDLRLRQLLVCPKILDPSIQSYGAALEDLVDVIQDDSHVAIFTPFRDAIPHIRDRLQIAGIKSVVLHGGITPDEQADRINTFRKDRTAIICTVQYAQSFSLEPADRAFFLGYDFDPDVNRQAESRIMRFTTEYPVNAYYYAYEDTYDERVAEIVCQKQQQINVTLDPLKVGLKF